MLHFYQIWLLLPKRCISTRSKAYGTAHRYVSTEPPLGHLLYFYIKNFDCIYTLVGQYMHPRKLQLEHLRCRNKSYTIALIEVQKPFFLQLTIIIYIPWNRLFLFGSVMYFGKPCCVRLIYLLRPSTPWTQHGVHSLILISILPVVPRKYRIPLSLFPRWIIMLGEEGTHK